MKYIYYCSKTLFSTGENPCSSPLKALGPRPPPEGIETAVFTLAEANRTAPAGGVVVACVQRKSAFVTNPDQ